MRLPHQDEDVIVRPRRRCSCFLHRKRKSCASSTMEFSDRLLLADDPEHASEGPGGPQSFECQEAGKQSGKASDCMHSHSSCSGTPSLTGSPALPPIIFAGLRSPTRSRRSASSSCYVRGRSASQRSVCSTKEAWKGSSLTYNNCSEFLMETKSAELLNSVFSSSGASISENYVEGNGKAGSALLLSGHSSISTTPRSASDLMATTTSSATTPLDAFEPSGCLEPCTTRDMSTPCDSPPETQASSLHALESLDMQVKELDAALSHSKAREALFIQSLSEVREELDSRTSRLQESQALLEALEKEHRRLKSSFRELMDATLEGSTATPGDVPASENIEMSREASITTASNVAVTASGEGGSTTSGPGSYMRLNLDALKCSPATGTSLTELRTHRASLTHRSVATPRSKIGGNRVASYVPRGSARARSRSLPASDTREENFDLRQQLYQAQQLLATLQGTNSYAQKVVQRNSELELRCSQLEAGYDEHIRELHEELGRTRRSQAAAKSEAAKKHREVERLKEEVVNLHGELRDLHEKQRMQRSLALQLKEASETAETLRDALDTEKTQNHQAKLEWEEERARLTAALEFEQRRVRAVDTDSAASPDVLALRIGELEDILVRTREETAEKLKVLEVRHLKSQAKIRELTTTREQVAQEAQEWNTKVDALQRQLTLVSQREQRLQKELEETRTTLTESLTKAHEKDEYKNKYEAAQRQIEHQSEQIARHLQALREANARFADLVERNAVLDCLLHNQQKEKEKTIAEYLKTQVQLYDQSATYRQNLEAANREITCLKKQLAEADEVTRTAVQAVEVAKMRELRDLKQQHATNVRTLKKQFDAEMTKFRDMHEKDLLEIRQQREGKIEVVANRYELHLNDLKAVHEQKVQFLQDAKEEAIAQLKEEHAKQVADLQATAKERVNVQRTLHEEEIASLTAIHQKNIKEHLKTKATEIQALKQTIEEVKASAEQAAAVSAQRIEELKQQLCRAREIGNLADNDERLSEALEVNHQLEEKLKQQIAAHEATIADLKQFHAHEIESLNRKFLMLRDQLADTEAELTRVTSRLVLRQQDEAAVRQDFEDKIAKLEDEKSRLVAEAHQERDQAKEDLESARNHLEKLSKQSGVNDTIAELQKRISLLEEENAQIEERLQREAALMKDQLEAKDERLQALLTTSQHVSTIIARNNELEELRAQEAQNYSDTIQEKIDNIVTLESSVKRLTKALKDKESEYTTLVCECEALRDTIRRLEYEEERAENSASLIKERDIKILELTESLEAAQLKASVEAATVIVDPEACRRRLETVKQLGIEITTAKDQNRRLMVELADLRKNAEASARLTLEVTLLNNRIQAQQQTIDTLRERCDQKQRLIDDLANQLMSQDKQDTVTSSSVPEIAGVGNKILELTKKCQELEDEKLSYERECRATQLNIELEKQLFAQFVDQKDRQMRQLLETNQRAESLFARNAELEELLLAAQAEIANLRQELQLLLRAQTASDDNSSAGQRETSTETETLRLALEEKEKRIQKLNDDIRAMKSTHTRQIEALNTRLRFVTLEQSLSPVSGEGDLLKLLVEKTTELQKEVVRLQKERDAQVAAQTKSRRSLEGNFDSNVDFLVNEIALLETRVDSLLADRGMLTSQIEELQACIAKTSSGTPSMEAARGALQSLTALVTQQRHRIGALEDVWTEKEELLALTEELDQKTNVLTEFFSQNPTDNASNNAGAATCPPKRFSLFSETNFKEAGKTTEAQTPQTEKTRVSRTPTKAEHTMANISGSLATTPPRKPSQIDSTQSGSAARRSAKRARCSVVETRLNSAVSARADKDHQHQNPVTTPHRPVTRSSLLTPETKSSDTA